MLPINKHALARYNGLFDNQKYQSLARSIADDLHIERDTTHVADLMNAVTDTALLLCQHSHYKDAAVRLAILCGQSGISVATIDRIHIYLLIYQRFGEASADDFMLTAKALLKAHELSDPLKAAV
ncbi:MAG: hypothetical protein KC546_20810, partial [Anaerolineae bacterium]|nr:hypothetical protein [Anaerolineae bacterium]